MLSHQTRLALALATFQLLPNSACLPHPTSQSRPGGDAPHAHLSLPLEREGKVSMHWGAHKRIQAHAEIRTRHTQHDQTHTSSVAHIQTHLRLRGGGKILRQLYKTYQHSCSTLPSEAVDLLLQWKMKENDLPNDVRLGLFVLFPFSPSNCLIGAFHVGLHALSHISRPLAPSQNDVVLVCFCPCISHS